MLSELITDVILSTSPLNDLPTCMPVLISERDARSLRDSRRYRMVTLLSFYHLRIGDF